MRDDGGCVFAYDPNIPTTHSSVLWRPEVFPGVLLLTEAPSAFATAPFSAAAIGPVFDERADADGREIVIRDSSGELHISLRHAEAERHPAIILPLDDMMELRLDVAASLVRRLCRKDVDLLPARLRLTPLQKARLIQLLHTFDILRDGGGRRDIAKEILNSEQARLPSVEWKDSAARRKATRLVQDATALVERGYLKLLRGD
ncbi:DUF2285 domain-containing protein [Methylocystis sp. JR02]|uniref:DUF2285 domain-containing protein n=1 Tax=Methylocystis sp. JR02 TaxID=3046284 RepID=UPI0024BB3C0D|nr:DUF2285 domain-containing protein [Methylocystis sp. JR02]MDJ0448813.1 DUF2285 domain-containing protein [Methylocystis sp. JR02]